MNVTSWKNAVLYVHPVQHEAPAVALQGQRTSVNVPIFQEEECGGIRAQLPMGAPAAAGRAALASAAWSYVTKAASEIGCEMCQLLGKETGDFALCEGLRENVISRDSDFLLDFFSSWVSHNQTGYKN